MSPLQPSASVDDSARPAGRDAGSAPARPACQLRHRDPQVRRLFPLPAGCLSLDQRDKRKSFGDRLHEDQRSASDGPTEPLNPGCGNAAHRREIPHQSHRVGVKSVPVQSTAQVQFGLQVLPAKQPDFSDDPVAVRLFRRESRGALCMANGAIKGILRGRATLIEDQPG